MHDTFVFPVSHVLIRCVLSYEIYTKGTARPLGLNTVASVLHFEFTYYSKTLLEVFRFVHY